MNMIFITYKTTDTVVISFAFSHEIVNYWTLKIYLVIYIL
jgi:hypothetical protein